MRAVLKHLFRQPGRTAFHITMISIRATVVDDLSEDGVSSGDLSAKVVVL